jgi:hypothetical protein
MAAEPVAGTTAREPLLGHVVGMIGKCASHVDRVTRQNARREGIPPLATAPPPPVSLTQPDRVELNRGRQLQISNSARRH